MEAKTCERCGREFGCGAQGGQGCWCAEHALKAETLARLAARWGDCLCPDCLREMAADPGPPSPAEP